MSHGMISASPDATAHDVARMMASRHIHAVVVAGTEHEGTSERLRWGVIDARDLIDAALQGRFDDAAAGDLAGPPLLVDPEMPVDQSARPMPDAGATHAVVVVDRGQPAGVVPRWTSPSSWRGAALSELGSAYALGDGCGNAPTVGYVVA
jgi:CBS domain-containing protein